MKPRVNRLIRIGLACAGLVLGAGTVQAGKTTAQFSVTLTVTTECSIRTTAAATGGQSSTQGRDAPVADFVPAVDTRCSHGGQVDVGMSRPDRQGLSIVDVAEPGTTSQNGRTRSRPAPIVVTVTF